MHRDPLSPLDVNYTFVIDPAMILAQVSFRFRLLPPKEGQYDTRAVQKARNGDHHVPDYSLSVLAVRTTRMDSTLAGHMNRTRSTMIDVAARHMESRCRTKSESAAESGAA